MYKHSILVLLSLTLLGQSAFSQPDFTVDVTYRSQSPAAAQLIIDRTGLGIQPEVNESLFKSGVSKIDVRIGIPRLVTLLFGTYRFGLYAEPGADLHFTIDESGASPSVQLDGSCAQANGVVQRFYKQFGDEFNDSLQQAKMLVQTVDEFEMMIFSQRKKQLDFLKADADWAASSGSFKSFFNAEVDFHYWQLLLTYPIIRANSDRNILVVTPLPEVMLEGMVKLNPDQPSSLANPSYREFLKYYITYQTSKANQFNKFKDYTTSADRKSSMAREKLSDPVYLYWVARFLKEDCSNLAPFMVKKLKVQLSQLDPAPKPYFNIINSICDERRVEAPVKEGEKAPATQDGDLVLTNLEGKRVNLSDFKGKVVYIDFWASWCGPCRAMMPASRSLHDGLTDQQKKKVVFLYISIDASEEGWRKAINDMGIQGINVISPGNWNSPACRYFQINSIPRYMIMDKKGEIVEMNAPRPTDPELMQRLLRLAGE